MVASKGRALGGIRILHDAVISNEEKDFKLYGNERAGDGTIASIPKFPRKPVLGNAYSKSNVHTDLRNAKGKLHSGRKALADISNAKKERSQQFPSWPSNKPKLIRIDKSERTTRMKSEEAIMLRGKINNGKSADGCMLTLAKGITVADVSSIRSNRLLQGMQNSFAQISQRHTDCQSRRRKIETNVIEKNQINLLYIGSKSRKNHIEKVPQIRFLVGKQKNTKTTTTSTKPTPNSSKLQRTLMTSKASNTEMFEITKHVGNKKKDVPRALCNPIKAVGSQTQCLSSIGNECSNNSVNKTMSTYKSNRRKSYTLSLVVDSLPNIDDSTNPLEVVEYVDDIYHYYWTMEVERPCLANYMEIQSEITPKMRCVLVNWLIEVHHKYQLMEESLFLMIELLDRLLSIVNIKKNELQLYGLTALLLASKFEDYSHPKVDELISLSVVEYTRDEMLHLEMSILQKLRFRINVPTTYVFMLRFLKAAQSNKMLEDLAFYLIELCLVENESLKYKPSLLCASAIFVARSNLKLSPPWTGLLHKHSHYEESQLRTCAEMILRLQRAASCKPVKYTYHKYLKPDRSCVASLKAINLLPP